ncbi:organic cation transporter protein isoform X2 [Lingula anatina]|nr:organic cation transporter protein isoform X2 [Lingula anatina]|eukprot:XP_013411039.1 organic cation transporter protein isoform X2 [Lingula anatina]
MHFDDILRHIGEFGKFQIIKYLILCISSISAGCHMMVAVFIQVLPKHRCMIPGLPNDTYAIQGAWHELLINETIPLGSKGDYFECSLYSNFSYTNATYSCDKWVYDKSVFTATFATDFGLANCGEKWKIATAQIVFMAGVLVGAFVMGALSDAIGRKPTLIISVLLQGVCGTAAAFAPEYYSFIVLRFFVGSATAGLFMTTFVLGMELVGPSKRMIAGISIEYFFAGGLIILTMVGYFLRDWRHIELAVSVPSFAYILYWWFVPESARWLLANGKEDKAEEILRQAAKVNGKVLPEKLFEQVAEDEEEHHGSILQIFRSPRTLVRTLIIFLNWCVVSMVYYGLSLNSGNLGGDIFLNFFLSGLVEFPAYCFCFCIDKVGRKGPHVFGMLLGGSACLCTIFVALYADPGDPNTRWFYIALSIVGKLGATMGFAIIYVWSAELYPTVLRNSLMGFSSTFARVGGMLAPVIANMVTFPGAIGRSAALIVFGAATVFVALLSILLPETAGRELPETIDDAEKVPFFSSAPKAGEDTEKSLPVEPKYTKKDFAYNNPVMEDKV